MIAETVSQMAKGNPWSIDGVGHGQTPLKPKNRPSHCLGRGQGKIHGRFSPQTCHYRVSNAPCPLPSRDGGTEVIITSPGRCHGFRLQLNRKPLRRQPAKVSGLQIRRARRKSGHSQKSETQKRRSPLRKLRRLPSRWGIRTNVLRRARISKFEVSVASEGGRAG